MTDEEARNLLLLNGPEFIKKHFPRIYKHYYEHIEKDA